MKFHESPSHDLKHYQGQKFRMYVLGVRKNYQVDFFSFSYFPSIFTLELQFSFRFLSKSKQSPNSSL